MNPTELAKSYAGGRVAIGLILMLFPRRAAKGMWGDASASSPAVKFLSRIVGARDVILGAGALVALRDGGPKAARPWMNYGAAADASDVVATLLGFRHLPRFKRYGLLLMAMGGAVTGGYLSAELDKA